jgi:rare lipoprotein A (peptidoglycan hydrolase)
MRKFTCLFLLLVIFRPGSAQDTLHASKPAESMVDTLRPGAFKVVGKPVTGNATIYDLDFDGSKTASGEVFFNIRLTAASNDFKLNTWVKVTNPKNKKYVIVRINDRLSSRQKKKGTAITLSREAGNKIGIGRKNTVKVKVEGIVTIAPDSVFVLLNDTTLKKLPDSLKTVDSLTPNAFKVIGKAVSGIASFYSYNLDGTKTATGERYRNAKLTAASNNFKLNTWVLVTNLRNKKSVIVRINDRMHPRMKKKGRVVDLSREAARLLDFMDNGLARVKVEPIKFIFSQVVKQELDSLHLQRDSTKQADSLKTDSLEKETHAISGIASFYSFNLDGTKTATGEIYRNNKMSAASNDFDLNTWVRVTNLSNNKSIIVRVNDRMHPRMQKKGRVVDLSRVAAKKLDFIKNGLANVKVEIVDKGTLN